MTHSRWVLRATIFVLAVPGAVAAIAGSGRIPYLAGAFVGVLVSVAIGVVVYAVLARRLRALRWAHPGSIFVDIARSEDTMLALAEGNSFAALPAREYVLEVSTDGMRLWGGIWEPAVIATIPAGSIIGISLAPGRMGVRRVTCISVKVQSRSGDLDIPLYPTGDGAKAIMNRSREGMSELVVLFGPKLGLEPSGTLVDQADLAD